MIDAVRLLAGSDFRTVDALLDLRAVANDKQKEAIGRGLAGAAGDCAGAYPNLAALLQLKVAALGANEIAVAFLDASGDVVTTEVAAPGAGTTGASLAGAVGDAHGGTSGDTGDSVTQTRTVIFSIERGGGFTSVTDRDVSPTTF
jgi:hypothetical protein